MPYKKSGRWVNPRTETGVGPAPLMTYKREYCKTLGDFAGYEIFDHGALVGRLVKGAYSRTGGTGWGISGTSHTYKTLKEAKRAFEEYWGVFD